jgi:ABC-2 type transport system permease protein
MSAVILFMLPMITMAAFADEKRRNGASPSRLPMCRSFGSSCALRFLSSCCSHDDLHFASLALQNGARPVLWLPGIAAVGWTLISLGVFISALTENQIWASITFGAFLILWVIDLSARGGGTVVQEIVSYLSILNHFEDFSKGVIDTASLVVYGSFIFLGLFLTYRSIESLRWRQ